MTGYDFTVQRANLAEVSLQSTVQPAANAGQVVVAIERFAISNNNITYGVAGDTMGYWNFFPAADGEGHLPVWGIATVVDSAVDGLHIGTRYYGYFPMASHHVFEAQPVDGGFVETVAHRQALPPLYNFYAEVSEIAGFDSGFDSHQALYRILFETGFVLDYHLAENSFFGADQVILSSASSKTAISAAFALERRDISVVGLTSTANRDFVEALDLYDEVVIYDEAGQLDPDVATAYIDVSGNGGLLETIHQHFGDRLVLSYGLGATHRDQRGSIDRAALPGAPQGRFFAPTDIQALITDRGVASYYALMTPMWRQFLDEVGDWISITEHASPDGLEEAYRSVLNGNRPDVGVVLVN